MRKAALSLFFTFYFLITEKVVLGQIRPDQIDSLMKAALEKLKIAGAAVAVVKDEKVIFQKGYGVKLVNSSTFFGFLMGPI